MKPLNDTLIRSEETIVFLVYPQDVHYKYLKMLCTVQPGVVVSPHKHPRLTESFRLVSGGPVAVMIEGKAQQLVLNDPIATAVLPNTVHAWTNGTDQPLTFEVMLSAP